MVLKWQQAAQIISSFIAEHVAYASTNKAKIEFRKNLPTADAPHVYVRAWLISTQNFSAGADIVGGSCAKTKSVPTVA